MRVPCSLLLAFGLGIFDRFILGFTYSDGTFEFVYEVTNYSFYAFFLEMFLFGEKDILGDDSDL